MRRSADTAPGIVLASIALVACLTASASQAQTRRASLSELAVDFVSLRAGPQLRGAVIGQADGQVTMVVSREWLKGAFPTYFRHAAQDEVAGMRETYTSLIKRIDAWLKEAPKRKSCGSCSKASGGEPNKGWRQSAKSRPLLRHSLCCFNCPPNW